MKLLLGFLVLSVIVVLMLSLGRTVGVGKPDASPLGVSSPELSFGELRSPVGPDVLPSGRLSSEMALPEAINVAIDRMVVHQVQLELLVPDAARALRQVEGLVKAMGGYIASAQINNQEMKGSQEAQRRGTVTLRVPAERLDEALAELRGVAEEVRLEQRQARDVTEEFTDLDAQLRSWEATETRYLDLLKQAKTVDEVLKIQQKLTETRSQIERLRGRMVYLERTSAMASITVTLLVPPPSLEGPIWKPLEVATEAWERSLRLLQGIADRGITAVVFSWWIWGGIGTTLGIWSLLRRQEVRS